jgi:hypothetical protein
MMKDGSSYIAHLPSKKTVNVSLDGESLMLEVLFAQSLAEDSGLHESTNEG